MNKSILSNVKIVLVCTTHPGNIGATARAMKNMGLQNLCLVKPAHFPHVEATARAAGADDILENASIKETVIGAIEDCELVIGASARLRNLSLPLLNPKECADLLFSQTPHTPRIAILFGKESSGLSNEDLMRCHYHLYVPTEPDFYSLNLAAAVQIMTYELRMAFLKLKDTSGEIKEANQSPEEQLANRGELERFYIHLEETLKHLDFLRPPHSTQVLQRLKRLFNRSMLETRELNILRGILSAIGKRT